MKYHKDYILYLNLTLFFFLYSPPAPSTRYTANQNSISSTNILQPYSYTANQSPAPAKPYSGSSPASAPKSYAGNHQAKPYSLRIDAKQGPNVATNEVSSHHGLYAGVGKYGFMDEAKSNSFFTKIGEFFNLIWRIMSHT